MKRITTKKLGEYRRTLNQREKEVLHSIQKCRFLKTDQVGRLHFGGSPTPTARLRAATRALAKMQVLGLVQPLQRRIGGVRKGSTSYVWTLKTAGVDLLRLGEETPAIKPRPRKRIYEPTYIFLKHTLAIAELYTRLRTSTNLLKIEFEPDCWRTYSKSFGVATTLKPDLYAITTADSYADHWFFEVDLATEAPCRIMQKCESYGRYYLTGQEQKHKGVFPKVVWVVPDEKRRQALKRHIRENVSEYGDLFAVITFEGLGEIVHESCCNEADNQGIAFTTDDILEEHSHERY